MTASPAAIASSVGPKSAAAHYNLAVLYEQAARPAEYENEA